MFQPDGKIFLLLKGVMSDDSVDLAKAMDTKNSAERKKALDTLSSIVTDLLLAITDIMVIFGTTQIYSQSMRIKLYKIHSLLLMLIIIVCELVISSRS